VIGDNGTGAKEQYEVAAQMEKFRQTTGFDFVLMNGYDIYGGKSATEVKKKFESPYASLLTAGVKFYATLSAVVDGVNDKRSVRLALVDDRDKGVSVGNLTIPPNHPIPRVGDVVEVRYLYCHVGGSLYQPTYLGVRDDVEPAECLVTQLKFKRDEND